MNTKQFRENQAGIWEYLPDTDTLLKYLDRNVLVELSKCSKRYRNQLEHRVFENLSLETWEDNHYKVYCELKQSHRLEDTLVSLKADLGSKLKFAKSFILTCAVNISFAKLFVELFPNIKTLYLNGCNRYLCWCCGYNCCLEDGLIAVLKSMKCLEHVYLCGINGFFYGSIIDEQTIPKSLKSLKIESINNIDLYQYDIHYDQIFESIDNSYTNLYSLTVITNTMLQNLTFGMPNLREVDIIFCDDLDIPKTIEFLKANPQLRKLKIESFDYNEEILKIILSSKYLEYWSIDYGYWEEVEFNNLQPNYLIKYLRFKDYQPDPPLLHLANTCKNLKTLELEISRDFNILDWSKLERRVNKLKLIYNSQTTNFIKKLDALRLFNSIHIEPCKYDRDNINNLIDFDLSNYKVIHSSSRSCSLKLIN